MSAARTGAGTARSGSASSARATIHERAVMCASEVDVAEEEVRPGVRTVVAVEAISVIETDVPEQGDLHAQTDAGAHLEVERLDLSPQVPGVSRIEEDHTVERMNNGKLLLGRVQ